MPLTYESTHEYHFNSASLFYCLDHTTLRVCDSFTDSVLISGVEQDDINDFIEKYMEYVLKDEELVNIFKKSIKYKKLNENLENHNHSKDAADA